MFRLVRAAIDAQLTLTKRTGERLGKRAAMLAIAALFGLFAFGLLHVAAFDALEGFAGFAPVWSALIVVGGDVLVSLVFFVVGRAGGVDARSVEARITRDRALTELRNGLAIATITGPAGRLAGRGAAGLFRSVFSRRKAARVR